MENNNLNFCITSQQFLVMFDIVKGCLYSSDKQFAGYSKEDIGKLLNDIISQQDNQYIISVNPINEIIEEEEKEENDFWN